MALCELSAEPEVFLNLSQVKIPAVEQMFCQEVNHSVPLQMTNSLQSSVHLGITLKWVPRECSQQAYLQV